MKNFVRKSSLIMCLFLLFLTACSEKSENTGSKNTSKPSNSVSVENTSDQENLSLLVYSGAGLKNPMEEIKSLFESKTGVKIELVYAGSGQLLSQLEQSGKGDVLIVGSKATYDAAVEKDLADEPIPVAHHTPVIITTKENSKNITGLKSLTDDNLKLALGDPDANAIGKTSVKMFEKANLNDYEKNVVVKTATVNELYQAISSGSADAAIVTKDSAFGKDDLTVIEIEPEYLIDQVINIGVLKTTENKDLSSEFVDFVKSDESTKIFENFGFKPFSE